MATIDGEPRSSQLPDELRRWNWGAFLLNWIWGIGNNTFIALLTLIPVFGVLVMPFVLGAKGNEWAWRNGRWTGVEHFRSVQRRWAFWGFVVPIAMVCLFGALFGGLFYVLKTSDAYRLGATQLQRSRAATDLLGTPIETGFPMGSISVNGQSGHAALEFTATGSKSAGRVFLRAIKQDGIWSLTGLRLRVEGRGDAVDLLQDDRAAVELRPIGSA